VTYRLHPQVGLGEVKLKVSNLERSVRFYEEVLGFQTARRAERVAEMCAADGRVLLILEEIPDAIVVPPNRTTGLYHFAILLPTRRDLGLALRRMIDKGIEIGQADHAVSEALYISDPDYNGIEVYRDRPREEWTYEPDGSIHMVTEPIDWRGLLREAEGHEWRGLPEKTVIGHVHLHVGDLYQARKFYCEQFGFDMMVDVGRFMGALFVSAGGYHHHLGLNIWAGRGAPRPPANGTGLDYYTITFPDVQALQSTLDHLRANGIAVREQDDRSWRTEDPSGNGIRLRLAEA